MNNGRVRRGGCFLAVALLLLATVRFLPAAEISPQLQAEIRGAAAGEEIPVIVTMTGQKQIGPSALGWKGRGSARTQARADLIRSLRGRAETSQTPLKAFLRGKGETRLTELWILNALALKASPALIEEIARQPQVASVKPDAILNLPQVHPAQAAAPEWNISDVHAPALWNLGFTGQGVTVAIMDTGADINHPDIGPKWRGGTNSWFNPFAAACSQPGATCSSCDASANVPCDYLDSNNVAHGTGVMGVMVGGDSGGTSIGVAPGAQWIAAKIFNSNSQAPLSVIHAGFQWLLDPDGNPDTDDAPDVVNDSWGFDTPNTCDQEFAPDIAALKAAGVAVVFSAGNLGPGAATADSPASLPASFAAGAVDQNNLVAGFSSRGPSPCDPANPFPEVVAPAVDIKTANLSSAATPESFQFISGTSFSAPHVAGVMALLLSAFPNATVPALEATLKSSARDLGTPGPDNDYGFGLVDALAAFNTLSGPPVLSISDSISPTNDRDLPFGSIPVGRSAEQTLTLSDSGGGTLEIGAIGGTGTQPPFALAADNCSGRSLQTGESCTVSVRFAPTLHESYSADLLVPTNISGDNPAMLSLSGLGNSPPVAAIPVSPADGATNVSIPVTLEWVSATDPDGDPVQESVILSTSPGFSQITTFPATPASASRSVLLAGMGGGILFLGLLAGAERKKIPLVLLLIAAASLTLYSCGGGGGGGSSPSPNATYTLQNLNSGVTYYWKISSRDSFGAVTESGVRSFTTR